MVVLFCYSESCMGVSMRLNTFSREIDKQTNRRKTDERLRDRERRRRETRRREKRKLININQNNRHNKYTGLKNQALAKFRRGRKGYKEEVVLTDLR